MKSYRARLLVALFCTQLVLLASSATYAASADEPEPTGTGETIEGDPFAGTDLFSDDLLAEIEPAQNDDDLATFELHGYLESRNQYRLNESDFLSARQRLWLEANASYGVSESPGAEAPLRLFASGASDFDSPAADLSDDHPNVRVYLEEAYLTIDRAGYNVIIGQKLHRIGTGDGVNPLDLINPRDYRDPVASGRSDSREPVPLAMATFDLPLPAGFQEASLETIVVPLAQVNQFNSPGSAWEPLGLKELRAAEKQGQLVLESQDEPHQAIEEAEYLLRLAGTVSGWDLALIGFYGYLDPPVFTGSQRPDGGGGTVLHLTPVHPDFSAFGINFAKGLERSTVRGELSLKPNIPVQKATDGGDYGYLRTAVTEGVLGIDRTFGVNLYTNLQYFFTWTDRAERVVSRAFSHGLSYEVHDKFLYDDLTLGIRGIIGFSEQGWTFESYAEYELADDWTLEGSALFFEGPKTGGYGQYGDNDMLTLRIRYSF